MKISELKQPYRKMSEYLSEKYCSGRTNLDLMTGFDWSNTGFDWGNTGSLFWDAVNNGEHPEITKEIKSFFPDDFDFSGEEENTKTGGYALTPEFSDAYNRLHEYTRDEFYKAKKRAEKKQEYTQLAKEGKFDELPDTCEFSEPVWLEVCDNEADKYTPLEEIIGKFKGRFIEINFSDWKIAKIPAVIVVTFPLGSIVEVVTPRQTYYGMIEEKREKSIKISMGMNTSSILIHLSDIKTINKIK